MISFILGRGKNAKIRQVSVIGTRLGDKGYLGITPVVDENNIFRGSTSTTFSSTGLQILLSPIFSATKLSCISSCMCFIVSGGANFLSLGVLQGTGGINLDSVANPVIRQGVKFQGNLYLKTNEQLICTISVTTTPCQLVLYWHGFFIDNE